MEKQNNSGMISLSSYSIPISQSLTISPGLVEAAYSDPSNVLFIQPTAATSSDDTAGSYIPSIPLPGSLTSSQESSSSASAGVDKCMLGIDEQVDLTGDFNSDIYKVSGGDHLLLYHPLQLVSIQRKITQMALLGQITRGLREEFNKKFDELFAEKETTMEKVSKFRTQMLAIQQQLSEAAPPQPPIGLASQQAQLNASAEANIPSVPSLERYLSLNSEEKPQDTWEVVENELFADIKEKSERYGDNLSDEEIRKIVVALTAKRSLIPASSLVSSALPVTEEQAKRALHEMMDNTLQGKSEEDLLTTIVPREPFFDTIPYEKMNEEQRKIVAEYNKKVEVITKFRKARENELSILAEQSREALHAFDVKLEELLIERLSVSKRCFENELWISKLSETILVQEGLSKEDNELKTKYQDISEEKKEKKLKHQQCERHIDILKVELQHMKERNKQFDFEAKSSFEREIKKVTNDKVKRAELLNHCLFLYKMKIREQTRKAKQKQKDSSPEIVAVNEGLLSPHSDVFSFNEDELAVEPFDDNYDGNEDMLNTQNYIENGTDEDRERVLQEKQKNEQLKREQERQRERDREGLKLLFLDPYLPIDLQNARDKSLVKPVELDFMIDGNQIITSDHRVLWEKLIEVRNTHLGYEQEVVTINQHIQELLSHKNYLENSMKFLDEKVAELKKAQQRVSERIRYTDVDLLLLFRLLQGQVEIPPQPCITSFADAVLLDRKEILDLNSKLRAQTLQSVNLLKVIGTVNKSMHWRKWEAEATDMAIEDEKYQISEFHILRVSKDLQDMVRTGDDSKHKREVEQLKAKREYIKTSYVRKMNDVIKQQKVLEKQLMGKEVLFG
jgi:hypothetical protein